MGGWRPLSRRKAGFDPSLEGPFEGVPDWLKAELWAWVQRALFGTPSSSSTQAAIQEFQRLPRLRSLAHALRTPLELISDGAVGYNVLLGRLHALVSKDDELFLDVVDYVLSNSTPSDRRGLDTLLASAGSAWRVGSRGKALERRVDSTATLQMATAIDADEGP